MIRNLLTLCLCSIISAASAQGTLDPEFADQGQFVFFQESQSITYAHDIIVDSENRIVVCGQHFESSATSSAFVLRMFQDGTLDTSFGTDGIATFASGTIQSQDFLGIRQKDNGNYVAIGGFQPEFDVLNVYLTEIDESGSLVSELGGGQPSAVFSASSYNYRFALKSNGKLLLSYSFNPFPNLFTTSADVFLRQFNEDGTPDLTFGTNGLFTYGVDQADDRTYDIGIDTNGNIFLSGYTRESSAFGVVAKALVLGITAQGQLLNTFGDNGVALVEDALANLSASAIDVTSTNDLVFAGFRYSPGEGVQLGMMGKMNSSGELVSTFGDSGIRLLPDYLNGEFYAIEELADGHIVAAGRHTGSSYDVIVTKLNASGTLVSGFGNGGTTASWNLAGGEDFPHQMAIDGTGNIIVCGRAQANSSGGGGVTDSGTRSGDGGGFSNEVAFVLRYLNQYVLSVNPENQRLQLAMYPNPASDFVQFQLTSRLPIQILDLSGRLVRQIEVSGALAMSVRVADLSQGIYLVKQGDYAGRLVKN